MFLEGFLSVIFCKRLFVFALWNNATQFISILKQGIKIVVKMKIWRAIKRGILHNWQLFEHQTYWSAAATYGNGELYGRRRYNKQAERNKKNDMVSRHTCISFSLELFSLHNSTNGQCSRAMLWSLLLFIKRLLFILPPNFCFDAWRSLTFVLDLFPNHFLLPP